MATLAGGGTTGPGTGAPATSVQLNNPCGTVADSQGSLYIADQSHRVMKVLPGGTMIVFAGTGSTGYNGDNQAATTATLYDSSGVALNTDGSVFIADRSNHRIRLVLLTGVITTAVGTGSPSFCGDGGQATSACIQDVYNLAVDPAGNLYIADHGNHRIRFVNKATGVITSLAGTGAASFSGDNGLAVAAALNSPWGITRDSTGNIYFSDTGNHRIRRISTGGIIKTVVGTGTALWAGDGGPSTSAQMNAPQGIAIDAGGNIYIADNANYRIRVALASGIMSTFAGTGAAGMSGDGGPPIGSTMTAPTSVSLDTVGNVYITQNGYSLVRCAVSAAAFAATVTPAIFSAENVNPTSTTNILLTGSTVLGLVQVTSASIGGYSCASLTILSGGVLRCNSWPIGSAAAAINITTQFTVSYTWQGYVIKSTSSVTLARRPVIVYVSPTTVDVGTQLLIYGYNFYSFNISSAPSVFVGGLPCTSLVVLVDSSLLKCTLPDVPTTTTGYPTVSVVVYNSNGDASINIITVDYPSRISVAFVTPTNATLYSWPSSSASPLPITTPVVIQATGQGTLTCFLSVSSCQSPNTGRPSDVTTPVLVGNTSQTVTIPSNASSATVTYVGMSLRSSSGALCSVNATCTDTRGKSAVAPTQLGISAPNITLDWVDAQSFTSSSWLPAVLPPFISSLSVAYSMNRSLTPFPATSVSCTAALFTNGTNVPIALSLSYFASSALSNAPALLTPANNTSILVNVTSLTAASAYLGSTLTVYVECTWLPTNERIRPLYPLTVRMGSLHIDVSTLNFDVLAYMPSPAWSAFVVLPIDYAGNAGIAMNTAGGSCSVQIVNTSTPGLQMAAATLSAIFAVLPNGTIATQPFTVEGPSNEVLFWRLRCQLWNDIVYSSPVKVTSAPIAVGFVGTNGVATGAGFSTVEQDAVVVLPITPPITVGTHGVGSVTCSLAIDTSTITCPSALPAYGVAISSRTETPALVGQVAVTINVLPTLGYAIVSFSNVGVNGPSGCIFNLTATCRDSSGRVGSTQSLSTGLASISTRNAWSQSPFYGSVMNMTAAMPMFIHMLEANWRIETVPAFSTLSPGAFPTVQANIFALDRSGTQPAWSADAVAALLCVAYILPTVPSVPLTSTLASFASYAISSCAGNLTSNDTLPHVDWNIPCLSTQRANLGSNYTVEAECVWTPTGERIRLSPIPFTMTQPTLSAAPVTISVAAFMPFNLSLSLIAWDLNDDLIAANASCQVVTAGVTSPSLALSTATATMSFPLFSDSIIPVIVEGTPEKSIQLQFSCKLWQSHVVLSNLVTVTTLPYVISADTTQPHYTWPSGSESQLRVPVAPMISLHADARTLLSCWLSEAQSSCPAKPSAGYEYSVGLGTSTAAAMLVGETSVSLFLDDNITSVDVQMPQVGVRSSSGCNLTVSATCRDGIGRTNTAGAAAFVRMGQLRAAWNDTSMTDGTLQTLVPTDPLSLPAIQLFTNPLISLSDTLTGGNGATAWVACSAGLWPAGSTLSLDSALTSAVGSVASSTAFSVTLRAPLYQVWDIVLNDLSSSACLFGSMYTVHAECTWLPTGERVRLQPFNVSTMRADVAWASGYTSTTVLGYSSVTLGVKLEVDAGNYGSLVFALASCAFTQLNSTVQTAQLQYDGTWGMQVDTSSYQHRVANISVNIQAPPGTIMFLQAECTLLGQRIISAALRVTTSSFTIVPISAIPTSFVPSDITAPWPVTPTLVLTVVASGSEPRRVTDATCTIASTTPNAQLSIADSMASSATGGSSLLTASADTDGLITMPAFIVQSSFDSTRVTVSITCARPAGDGPPALQLTLNVVPLRLIVCVPPVNHVASLATMPPFQLAIAQTVQGSAVCDGTAPSISLPQIICSISLNASASVNIDASSTFLQQATAVMDPTSQLVSFSDLMLTAPQDKTYALVASCYIGSVVIPTPYPFSVTLAGCPIGMAPTGVTCATCGGGQFSFGGVGAQCTTCPPVGAVCSSGVLTLQPKYYRPSSQYGQPIDGSTALFPCYNAEACTLNASQLEYGCSSGYTGPLCGVCDVSMNFARFGEACRACWSAASTITFVSAAVIIVVLLLARVALQKENQRSDASIMLRITMSYLAAVGSLRAFTAGSTAAYHDAMGWTDVVSASPLSVGALDCVARLPYLLQYVITICLPALAAVAVVLIFLTATTVLAVQCRPAPSFKLEQWREAVRVWLDGKRQWATSLFVLFVAYMPITSASLRALDCYAQPIDGVTYLRADLRVECYTGQHAIARIIAYVVLVLIGMGFPVGLAYLLGTATPEQLADPAFQNTWGFLFHGYKIDNSAAPQATLVGRSKRNSLLAAGAKVRRWFHSPLRGLKPPAIGSSRVWWESVVLLRKAGVVLLAVLVSNPYLQCMGATLWLNSFLLLQLHYKPYTKQLFNHLETLGLAASVVTAVVSTALLQQNTVDTANLHDVANMTPVEWAITVILIVVNISTFAILGCTWLLLQCRRVHTAVSRVPLLSRGTRTPSSKEPERKSVPILFTSDDDNTGFVGNPLRLAMPRQSLAPVPLLQAPGVIPMHSSAGQASLSVQPAHIHVVPGTAPVVDAPVLGGVHVGPVMVRRSASRRPSAATAPASKTIV
jgi:sugar lactone lactonase YvrE